MGSGLVGHIFQGRFKAIPVQKESYLLELCRYVVLNPVRADLVSYPEEWKWSSYLATIGMVEKPKFLCSDWILAQFGHEVAAARRGYKEFVLAGFKEESPWKDLKGRIYVAHVRYGYTLREIGDFLGVHYSTVSKALKEGKR